MGYGSALNRVEEYTLNIWMTPQNGIHYIGEILVTVTVLCIEASKAIKLKEVREGKKAT